MYKRLPAMNLNMLFAAGLLAICISSSSAQELRSNISVHDPVMTKQDDTYYLFCTGQGIASWSSKDLKNWKREPPVFAAPPQWAVEAVPGFKGHIWAPDISYYNGLYYLYYSVSAFGKNTSCIGLVTNTTLDPTDTAHYKWTDQGKIIQSFRGKTNWNAIDPNLVTDQKGNAYLAFGSFWDGLKMIRLKPDRMSVAEDTDKLPTIASRKRQPSTINPPAIAGNPAEAGGNAIEAPFIFKKDKFYYLFASIDYCCKGVNSTYKMIVGRAKNVKGPYLDKEGVELAYAGGTILLEGDKDWYGVGHNAVYTFDNTDYLVFHGYDAADNGKSKLRIGTLEWDKDGWPVVR
jgi:arabinan endo-1,5-alpha-L-arabinosidase